MFFFSNIYHLNLVSWISSPPKNSGTPFPPGIITKCILRRLRRAWSAKQHAAVMSCWDLWEFWRRRFTVRTVRSRFFCCCVQVVVKHFFGGKESLRQEGFIYTYTYIYIYVLIFLGFESWDYLKLFHKSHMLHGTINVHPQLA